MRIRPGNIFTFVATTLALLSSSAAFPVDDTKGLIRGFTMTEIGEHLYDAAGPGARKTEAQNVVDRLAAIGVKHINLSPRARMTDPKGSTLLLMTPPGRARTDERRRYLALMAYIHSKGMTVGVRPIFFVTDANGRTPVVTTQPDGSKKTWWHGNIQPADPNAWFGSFRVFLETYIQIAKLGKADEFTVGAELYSMTVGIEDQWVKFPHGFPGRWLELLKFTRAMLGPKVRISYDINFTDDKISATGIAESGGEFARWRYRLVDLANPTDPAQRVIWKNLVDFWNGLDAVGIDMYRSLTPSKETAVPAQYEALVTQLQQTADQYASQLDTAMAQIEGVTGKKQKIIFKEVGYKSVDKGFYNPGEYVAPGQGALNVMHQAAAYDATMRAFWAPQWDWFAGAIFWDASVNPAMHGPTDKGFSPLGKAPTEDVIKRYFLAP